MTAPTTTEQAEAAALRDCATTMREQSRALVVAGSPRIGPALDEQATQLDQKAALLEGLDHKRLCNRCHRAPSAATAYAFADRSLCEGCLARLADEIAAAMKPTSITVAAEFAEDFCDCAWTVARAFLGNIETSIGNDGERGITLAAEHLRARLDFALLVADAARNMEAGPLTISGPLVFIRETLEDVVFYLSDGLEDLIATGRRQRQSRGRPDADLYELARRRGRALDHFSTHLDVLPRDEFPMPTEEGSP